MNKIILEKLSEIEEKENVKILYAVESGSRAWGFASPDSDYDVRFIYARKPEYYLKLEKTRDVIEWQLDDVLDINGWDLDKTLKLLHASNPVLFEWNYSPIVYKSTKEWDLISSAVTKYFDNKKGLYHYYYMAKNNFKNDIKGDKVKLKKYFYVLRPIFACLWILTKYSPPPMLFEKMYKELANNRVKSQIEELVKIKTNSLEVEYGCQNDILNEFIIDSLKYIEDALIKMPSKKPFSWEELNNLFLNIVNI